MPSQIHSTSRLHRPHRMLAWLRYAALLTVISGCPFGCSSTGQTDTGPQGHFPQPAVVRAQPLPAQAIPAVLLTPTVAPSGDFTASVPGGWVITSAPRGDSFLIAAPGQPQPSAYFIVVDVSDLRYHAQIGSCSRRFNPFGSLLTGCTIPSIRTQLADSSREWAPPQALALILQIMQANAAGQLGAPSVIAVSSSSSWAQAFYRVTGSTPRGSVEHWGILNMIYLRNPMLSPSAVTSLALIAGCSAPPQIADSFRRTCAGIIDSYQFSPAWHDRIATGMVNIYQQEGQILLQMGYDAVRGFQAREQMITTFGQSMQSMQYKTFEAIRSKSYLNGEEWIATFGGNTLMKDPATGALISVPFGYASYGIDDRGLTPTVLAGPDEKPGASIGTAVSQRTLVSP